MKYIELGHLENIVIDDFVENCKLFTLFDTPINVLFPHNFTANIKDYKDVFRQFSMPDNIFFSCKSNKSIGFLKIASDNNCGIEVSSLFELKDALKFTNKIIASGPAKSIEYIDLCIKNNIIISIDDIEELKVIISREKVVDVLLRISDILGIISRFGINKSQIDECLNLISKSKVNLLGFSFHINNYNLDDRVDAINEIIDISRNKCIPIKYIDIGGGLPINYCQKEKFNNFLKYNNKELYFKNKNFKDFYPYYNENSGPTALKYILERVKNNLDDICLIIEPGRSLLNNTGISIYKVEYLKKLSNGDNIIITNGNINCLSEQWFNTDYLIEPLLYKKNKLDKLSKPIYASIAGNLCLEQDMLTWRKIKFDYMPENGDYLIYYNTSGYQMDSNESEFHKIPLVKKVLVEKKGKKYIVRKDEEYDCK